MIQNQESSYVELRSRPVVQPALLPEECPRSIRLQSSLEPPGSCCVMSSDRPSVWSMQSGQHPLETAVRFQGYVFELQTAGWRWKALLRLRKPESLTISNS